MRNCIMERRGELSPGLIRHKINPIAGRKTRKAADINIAGSTDQAQLVISLSIPPPPSVRLSEGLRETFRKHASPPRFRLVFHPAPSPLVRVKKKRKNSGTRANNYAATHRDIPGPGWRTIPYYTRALLRADTRGRFVINIPGTPLLAIPPRLPRRGLSPRFPDSASFTTLYEFHVERDDDPPEEKLRGAAASTRVLLLLLSRVYISPSIEVVRSRKSINRAVNLHRGSFLLFFFSLSLFLV